MIENQQEYEAAQHELRDLEDRLARVHHEHPNPEKGYTKVGIRKMIARLHEELGVYEATLSNPAARKTGDAEASSAETVFGFAKSYDAAKHCTCDSQDHAWVITQIADRLFALCPNCGYRCEYDTKRLEGDVPKGIKPFEAPSAKENQTR